MAVDLHSPLPLLDLHSPSPHLIIHSLSDNSVIPIPFDSDIIPKQIQSQNQNLPCSNSSDSAPSVGVGVGDVDLNENKNKNMEVTESIPEKTGIQNNPSEDYEFHNNGNIRMELLKTKPPHSHLPQPEAPPGLSPYQRSQSAPSQNNMSSSSSSSSFGKYIRDRTNSLSAAIVKTISSLQDNDDQESSVTEFNLSGLKVVVNLKNNDQNLKGRITFFSRSNCRDCKAVRTFFNQKGFKFVEINIDVYPMREKELLERTGNSSVPQIFFNEKLFGGLVALNSLRNSGELEFDRRMKEMLDKRCPEDAPAPPVYGFDDQEEDETDDAMVEMVKYLRQRLPIQDRLIKMKIVKNCFSGSEMVESLIHRLDCGRRQAVDVGKQMAQKLFIHHVFGENDFEDGNHYYRFLEHGPFISRCFNFTGSINDNLPKPAALVGLRLAKLMSAILESYASEDAQLLDYTTIKNSEEFRRYINLIKQLHRVNLLELSPNEKLAFFLNLYNAMVIHALIRFGRPEGVIDRKSFFSDFQYLVGGQSYSLITIKNGILRGNKRPPYSLVKPFSNGDKRLQLAFDKVNPLIHFGLCNGTKSSPRVRFYTPQGVEAELRSAAREFFQSGGVEVDLDKRTVYLTGIIKWFSVDFGQEKEIVKWIMSYLDANKAGLLTHLLGDGGPLNIAYQNYNWTMNS